MKITDQIQHELTILETPKRIVSVVPSQTELLYDLGLQDSIVGVTKFCVHPKQCLKEKKIVGGTKNLNLDKIAQLQPDLIIANKEENTKNEIKSLQLNYPVYTSDISKLEDAMKMIKQIGQITSTTKISQRIIDKINLNFSRLNPHKLLNNSVLYLIWNKPYMTIGSNTFINDMLVRCGLKNVIVDQHINYPTLNEEQIKQLNPAYIFLSSEPYPFKENHLNELQTVYPNSKILLVDGEYFSWYGSRLLGAVNYFIGLIDKIS